MFHFLIDTFFDLQIDGKSTAVLMLQLPTDCLQYCLQAPLTITKRGN